MSFNTPAFPDYTASFNQSTQTSKFLSIPADPSGGSGSAATGCIPWKPTLVKNGSSYLLRLNAGTINGVINSAWNNLVNIGTISDGELHYIIATVTFSSRQVSSIAYSTSSSIPSGNKLNPIAQESFPSQIKIILGTLVGTSACMVWASNLTISVVEVFKETIANPAQFTKPYKSWYGFTIT
jgi:hypothetical protein